MRPAPLLTALLMLLCTGGCREQKAPPAESRRAARVEEMVAAIRASHPGVPGVSVPGYLSDTNLRAHALLVDVRPSNERAVAMIPGAISRENYETHREDYAGRPVVAYCTIGERSANYVSRLRKRGTEAYNLEGSVLAWTYAGQDLVDATGITHRVHVYGPAWNLAAPGYEGVW